MKGIYSITGGLLLLILMLGSRLTEPKPEQAALPNILFCIADDQSYPHAGAYGTRWVRTPNFDRVAAEGLLFMNAYTPNAKCAPSRSCILTGRNSWQLEEAANHVPYFPAKFKSIMEVLRENGYHVGHTAKGWAPGNPGTVNGKPRQLTGPAYNSKKTKGPTSQISKIDYAANFEEFLNNRRGDQPFCFWYGSTEPHRAYAYGSGKKHGKKTTDIDRVPAYWPDIDSVRTDMLDYAFEIEYFDQHLGRMLRLLEERGELENTVVIVTSDNGMPFPRVKGQEFEASNHLPLAIRWKQGIVQPGRKVEDLVSFIDFVPTVLEVTRLTAGQTGMPPVQGRSLVDIFSNTPTHRRDYVLIGKERHDIGRPNDTGYPIRGIVKNGYLYLHNYEPERWPSGDPITGYLNTDGSPTKTVLIQRRHHPTERRYWEQGLGKRPAEELYQISKDPDCMVNLATEKKHQTTKRQLASLMEQQLRAQGDPRMFSRGAVFDNYLYAEEKTRNFYERYLKGEHIEANWVNKTDFDSSGEKQ
ncbi:sulfatase family protein [Telluribacter humicola]|uniref:sulfatase family protein n=1 Tax=Telluribacter humicola TaxID=1720261 RepID=UPI001A96A8E0|nr:sulfatase [Telluribacter humicola]